MTFYSIAWLVALVSTGLVAGAMTAHCFVLGTYLTHMHTDGRQADLRALMDSFKSRYMPRIMAYWGLYALQGVAITAFAAISVMHRANTALAVSAAVIGVPLWIAIHAVTFGALEARAMATPESLSAAERARFIQWNVPLHAFYAVCLGTAFMLLALIPLSP